MNERKRNEMAEPDRLCDRLRIAELQQQKGAKQSSKQTDTNAQRQTSKNRKPESNWREIQKRSKFPVNQQVHAATRKQKSGYMSRCDTREKESTLHVSE